MYSFVTAYAMQWNGWFEVDIQEEKLHDLYANYNKVQVTLREPVTDERVLLDMQNPVFIESLRNLELTFSQFLTENGDKTLPITQDNVGEMKIERSRYIPGWQMNAKVKVANIDFHPDAELPLVEATDLFIDGPSVKALKGNILASINGHIHPISYFEDGMYVVGGNRSGMKVNDNQIGYLDFSAIGGVDIMQIDSSFIYKPNGKYTELKDGIHIRTPKNDGGIPLLVLAGNLILLDGIVQTTGEGRYKLNVQQERLEDLCLDTAHLGCWPEEVFDFQDDRARVITDNVWKDETLKHLLDSPYTFLVFFKEKPTDVFLNVSSIADTQLTGVFEVVEGFNSIVMANGKVLDYELRHGGGDEHLMANKGLGLVTAPILRHNYLKDSRDKVDSGLIDGATMSTDRYLPTGAATIDFCKMSFE